MTNLDLNKIYGINREIKEKQMLVRRINMYWEKIIDEALLLEDIIDNKFSSDYKIKSTFWVERRG